MSWIPFSLDLLKEWSNEEKLSNHPSISIWLPDYETLFSANLPRRQCFRYFNILHVNCFSRIFFILISILVTVYAVDDLSQMAMASKAVSKVIFAYLVEEQFSSRVANLLIGIDAPNKVVEEVRC